MIEYTHAGTDQAIGAIGYTATQHVSRKPAIKIVAEAGRHALSITLTPDKTRALVEELIQALWAAEDGR